MAYTPSDLLADEKMKPHTITTVPSPQTPPHTPSITTAAAHKLTTEIYDIYHSLLSLSSLKPGDKVNALLTRLVDLCIGTYDQDFVADFFNVGGIHALCPELRSLCATAEGELESFWAQKLISESLMYNGKSTRDSVQHLRHKYSQKKAQLNYCSLIRTPQYSSIRISVPPELR